MIKPYTAVGLIPTVRGIRKRKDIQINLEHLSHLVKAAAWLSSLDLFVLPSYGEEGVPQAIMQAMACGLAVVSTPVGAINEAVKHNCTGLIVEPRNATALAEALARLMSNGSLRQHLGEAGRRYAQENFGIDAMLDKMEAVFRRVIESRASS